MKKLSIFSIGLMACLAIGITTARAQVFYSLEDLGVVKGMDASQPAALNNFGDVTGTAYKGDAATCAFHYDYSKKYMHDEGGVNSRAFGISSMGLIVGDSYFPAGEAASHAAIIKNGYTVDLGVLKGQRFSRANSVNAMGQVVGYSGPRRDSEQSRAFIWNNQTGMTDLGTLGGNYAQAYAINDAGFITGTAQLFTAPATHMPAALPTHAFLYNPKSVGIVAMHDLGVLGGYSSYGLALNGYEHVVGYSTLKPNSDRVHAFLHNGKGMIDLGSLGWRGTESDVSVALGVNKLDQVVGYSFLPTAGEMPLQQVAFLWSRGHMINLNRLLLHQTRKNFLLTSAVAINDNGQIAASAFGIEDGALHAVLLTPNGPATN